MAKLTLKTADIAAIISETEKQYAEMDLAKAEPEASKEASKEKSKVEKSAKKAEVPAAPVAEAAPAEAPAPEVVAECSLEELQAEYAALSPEELEKHKLALMAALTAVAPPAPAEAAPAEAPAAVEKSAPKMDEKSKKEASKVEKSFPAAEKSKEKSKEEAKKADIKMSPANGGKIKKSEPEVNPEVEELKELVKRQADLLKSQSEDLVNVSKAMEAWMDKPVFKGVVGATAAAPLKKSEEKELTKVQVDNLLKLEIPYLAKSERAIVTKYFLNGTVEGLGPILEKISNKLNA
jgi:hypothetical protein